MTMDRKTIIEKLSAFPYDRGEYWVVTGGAMVLYGIRPETGDIDLGCSKALADRLEADGYLCGQRDDGKRRFRYGTDIEIFEEWLYDRTETVESFRVITLTGLLEMKTALGREKDLRDIARIRTFLNNAKTAEQKEGKSMEEQIITITVKTKGEPCTLSDDEIRAWYAERVASLFDPQWGAPEITVDVERNTH